MAGIRKAPGPEKTRYLGAMARIWLFLYMLLFLLALSACRTPGCGCPMH